MSISKKASLIAENERLKSELRKATIRETAARETMHDFQRELNQRFSSYPVLSHPKVRFLMEVLATVLTVLQDYEKRKFSADEGICLIAASFESILKANRNLKQEEQNFISELDEVDDDDLPPELQMSFKKMEEGFRKVRESAERLGEKLDKML